MCALRRGILIVFVATIGSLQPIYCARSDVPAEVISDPSQFVSSLVLAMQSGDTNLLSEWLDAELLKRYRWDRARYAASRAWSGNYGNDDVGTAHRN